MLFPFPELVSNILLHLLVNNIFKNGYYILIMAQEKREILENLFLWQMCMYLF